MKKDDNGTFSRNPRRKSMNQGFLDPDKHEDHRIVLNMQTQNTTFTNHSWEIGTPLLFFLIMRRPGFLGHSVARRWKVISFLWTGDQRFLRCAVALAMLILLGVHRGPRTTDLVKQSRKSRVLWSDGLGLEHFLCPIHHPSISQPATHQILENPQGARHPGRLCGYRWAKQIQAAYILVGGGRHLTDSHTNVYSQIVVSDVESRQHSLSVDRGW